MTPSDDYVRRLLDGVASGRPVSQRSLARELGVALGLTNLLVRRLARKGWIRIVRVKSNRVLYLITPSGIAEKARMSRAYFQRSVGFYAETRNRIHESFEHLSATLSGREAVHRVVFFGAGEVAEVGFVVLGESRLELVGVVDDERTRSFFGVAVHPTGELTAETVAGRPYDTLIVMSFDDPDDIQARLAELGIPDAKVHWLEKAPDGAVTKRRRRPAVRRPAAVIPMSAAPPQLDKHDKDDPHQSSR